MENNINKIKKYSRISAILSIAGFLIILFAFYQFSEHNSSISEKNDTLKSLLNVQDSATFSLMKTEKKLKDSLRKNIDYIKLSDETPKNRNNIKSQTLTGIDTVNFDIARFRPIAVASPPIDTNSDGKLVYRFYCYLKIPTYFRQYIDKVEYFFNHESFIVDGVDERTEVSRDPKNNFPVSYRGWGCVRDVQIKIYLLNSKIIDLRKFDMCESLGWR